jgi:predicted O-methyltransferase YrrM
MYVEPNLYSSYKENNIGKTLYDTVIELNPNVVVEFGVLCGYSTLCIAQALRDLNSNGKLIAYDLFEEYEYRHGNMEEVNNLLIENSLEDFVELRYGNLYKWINNPDEFDLLHLDVSNYGEIIQLVSDKFKNKNILFEGGSQERDREHWMIKYKKTSIYPLKNKINYEILNRKWPSISLIRGKK